MALTAAHLNAGVILNSIQLKNFNHLTRGNFVVVMAGSKKHKVKRTTDTLPYPLPPPHFSPSLISLMVSVDVNHHVYILLPLTRSKQIKVLKNTIFIRIKHKMRIFGAVSFTKLLNDS